MKRKQTSTSAALAEPAAVKAPNLSFLFFSFSSSSIWKQRKKKTLTTTAQSRRAETSAKDINPMSAVKSGIVPFVKQKKHSSQSVLLSSSADQGSPSWRQERISIWFLSTRGVKWCIKKMWRVGLFVFSALTDDLLFASAPVRENKYQKASVRNSRLKTLMPIKRL